MGNSGSIQVPVDAIITQAVNKVAQDLLATLQPRLDDTERASCSARRRVTAGSGAITAIVVLAGWFAWRAYDRDQDAQVKRDQAISAQYVTIEQQLASTRSSTDAVAARLAGQAADLRAIKVELNRQVEAINAAWREEVGKRAVPRPYPFPDLVSGASPR